MRKNIIAALLGASLILASSAANAGYRGGGYHYGGHYRYGHHYHGYHRHDGAWIAAGVLGGALLLGTLLSAPYYYGPPAPAYYGPPPRQPYCVSDQVYRYLPDGRIQWGTRTRCY